MTRKPSIRRLFLVGAALLLLLGAKAAWICLATRHHGSLAAEKWEILSRSEFLADRIITTPSELLLRMPKSIGPQFQGEWALYSCSMYAAALVNIAGLYPETRDDALCNINGLIQIVLSPELRRYDAQRWGEDPLETLSGDLSHISYLSHLTWMIGEYRKIGGGPQYDELYDELCEAMNRRILQSPILNLPTYPDEAIYVPDMLVAIVALAEYARQHDGTYASTLEKWKKLMLNQFVDPTTGLIQSFIWPEMAEDSLPVKGSYSALSCYYLTLIDPEMAKDQYERLKRHFLKERPITEPDRNSLRRRKRDLLPGHDPSPLHPQDRRTGWDHRLLWQKGPLPSRRPRPCWRSHHACHADECSNQSVITREGFSCMAMVEWGRGAAKGLEDNSQTISL